MPPLNPSIDRALRRRARVCSLLRVAVLGLAVATTAATARETRTASTFSEWREAHQQSVAAFEQFLDRSGVTGVVQMHELLRSASSWQACKADPYAIPPREQWSSVVQVLRLLMELRAEGVLGQFEVHSAYRGPTLNACAGGASGSAHLRSFAVDFIPTEAGDPTDKLCEFWRLHGKAWNMGLSRYPSGRVHIDTSGHRTWGHDHTGKSAVCSRG